VSNCYSWSVGWLVVGSHPTLPEVKPTLGQKTVQHCTENSHHTKKKIKTRQDATKLVT
jgi:hypothetical protein